MRCRAPLAGRLTRRPSLAAAISRPFALAAAVGAVPVLLAVAPPTPVAAQVTATDYARAERFLPWNARNLVSGDQVTPTWLKGEDRFWYRNHMRDGYEFVLVDPVRGTRAPLFDHARLAAALSVAADTSYEGKKLPFQEFELLDEGRTLQFFVADSARWRCDLSTYACTGPEKVGKPKQSETASPDGKWVAFEREGNLWVREAATGQDVQLTRDAETDWGYAVSNVGCCGTVTNLRQKRELPPMLVWSEDSRRIATYRFDDRGVRKMPLIETSVKGPVLWTYPYALPGDSVIPKWDVWVFDVAARTGARAQLPAQDAVNTSCCWLTTMGPDGKGVWKDARWGSGSDAFFFTRGVRSYDSLSLVTMDARSGEARVILTETSKTFIEMNLRSGGIPNWRMVNANREVIWFSERDGWGHLYRFDATSGKLLNRLTEGPGLVVDLLKGVVPGGRGYYTAVGREPGRDPYYRHLYRVRMDGTGTQLLTPEDADHEVTFSPSGRWFTDTWSTPVTEPVTVLRRADGTHVLTAEKADFAPLLASGWQWPVPFKAKARDGITDLYGYLYFPPKMEAGKHYPVVDYIYPGPQTGPIGFRQASSAGRGNGQAFAELGFIVFVIDAQGTPLRSKAF
ncbi:MAG: S9 family peptidase, partial [Gemmatimonadetes bacterium]|nr:S9 family peptidase [Gemmatimonadota bacterium]